MVAVFFLNWAGGIQLTNYLVPSVSRDNFTIPDPTTRLPVSL